MVAGLQRCALHHWHIQTAHGTVHVRNTCICVIPHDNVQYRKTLRSGHMRSHAYLQGFASVRMSGSMYSIHGNYAKEYGSARTSLLRTVVAKVRNCPHYSRHSLHVRFLPTAVCGIVWCGKQCQHGILPQLTLKVLKTHSLSVRNRMASFILRYITCMMYSDLLRTLAIRCADMHAAQGCAVLYGVVRYHADL